MTHPTQPVTIHATPTGTHRHHISDDGLTLTSTYTPTDGGNTITSTLTWRDPHTAATSQADAIASFEQRVHRLANDPPRHLRARRTRLGLILTGHTRHATPPTPHPWLPRLHGHPIRRKNGTRSLTLDWLHHSLHLAHQRT